jgi:WW domain-containing protein
MSAPTIDPVLSNDPYPSSPNQHLDEVEQAHETPETPRSGSSPPESKTNTATSVEPTPASFSTSATTSTPSSGDWQAIWSPVHSAYYFYNSSTHETTWVNPLQPPSPAPTSGDTTAPNAAPSASTSTSTSTSVSVSVSTPSTGTDNPTNAPQEGDPSSSSSSFAQSSSGATPVPASIAQIYALQEAAAAQGIDPSLAYLDPSLAGGPSAAGGSGAYNFTAKFNAHTGTFTRPDGRDPTHLSEYERMKRMSSVYFNMDQWEQEVAQRKKHEDDDAANGKKRKRPTKKDLVSSPFLFCASVLSEMLTVPPFFLQERFKEQKKLKKIAKTAWLRT